VGAAPDHVERVERVERVELVRPFLRADRATIDAHIARHAIPFAVDPSNRDARFLRARVRHELLPLLIDLSPRIVEHLCALADDLVAARGASDDAAFRLALPRATQLALAALAARRSPNAEVALPGGLVAKADRAHGRERLSVHESNRNRWKHRRLDGRHHR
jgi:tRNA(Ile)-lysidine synthase